MGREKTEKIVVRCTESTKREWAAYATVYGSAEEALLELLNEADTGFVREEDGPF